MDNSINPIDYKFDVLLQDYLKGTDLSKEDLKFLLDYSLKALNCIIKTNKMFEVVDTKWNVHIVGLMVVVVKQMNYGGVPLVVRIL